MKTKLFLAALFCLLASASPISAQLTIQSSGRAEIGTDSFDPENTTMNPHYFQWLDTITQLKVFGNYEKASGGHMTFGDTYLYNTFNVALGELGYTDSDRLWLHGNRGTYVTAGVNAMDTVMYYDPTRSTAVKFNKDVHTSGVFVQSDERFKENIEPVGDDVLSLLEGLEAVSYTLKNDNARLRESLSSIPALTDKVKGQLEFYDKFYADNEKGSERYGFLAQNVKEVFPQLVYTDNSGYMYVDYIGLIPLLVRSINELRAELAEVKGEKPAEAVPALAAAQQSAQSELEASLGAAKLYQNAPNPWSSETVIRYSLPRNVASATIYIYDMQGAQLKSIPANGRDESQVTLTAHDLKAGMYLYALVADGALIDSKQMILTK